MTAAPARRSRQRPIAGRTSPPISAGRSAGAASTRRRPRPAPRRRPRRAPAGTPSSRARARSRASARAAIGPSRRGRRPCSASGPTAWRSNRRRCRERSARGSPGRHWPRSAASTAEPPRFRMSMAASVASGCAVPAAPDDPRGGAAGETGAGDAIAGVNVRAAKIFFAFGLKLGQREINCVGFCRRILREVVLTVAAATGSAAIKERRREWPSRVKAKNAGGIIAKSQRQNVIENCRGEKIKK